MDNTPQENPLNPVIRESQVVGRMQLLSELINAARKVGATSISVEALLEQLEDLAKEKNK